MTRALLHWTLMVVGAAAPALTAPASAQTPLVSTVEWTDPGGSIGTLQFEGVANGSSLEGIARSGGGEELRVTGAIGSDGTVSGTLRTEAGASVGTFSGQLSGQPLLQGNYQVSGGGGGDWSSPADELPVPPE